MLPSVTTNTAANRDIGYAVLRRQSLEGCCARRVLGPNCFNFYFRQLGALMVFAMTLASLLIAVASVIPTRSEKQMLGVDTRRVVAFVANECAVWNWSVNTLPCVAMGLPLYFIASETSQNPVPIVILTSIPDYTSVLSRWQNVTGKTGFKRDYLAGTSALSASPLSTSKAMPINFQRNSAIALAEPPSITSESDDFQMPKSATHEIDRVDRQYHKKTSSHDCITPLLFSKGVI